MCKPRLDSQGMILNAIFEGKKNVNVTRAPHPPSFMANAIKNFHIFFDAPCIWVSFCRAEILAVLSEKEHLRKHNLFFCILSPQLAFKT